MVKDYCECCGNKEQLTEQQAERKDKKLFKITICNKCLFEYREGKF